MLHVFWIIIILSADEDSLSFSCHFRRGSLSNQESPVYEIVKLSGFQYWNRDKCKYEIVKLFSIGTYEIVKLSSFQ